MKVLGIVDSSTYLCEVGHSELEKSVDKYYGHLPKLKVGSELDLGLGYDFRSAIKEACKATVDADIRFHGARQTLHKFAIMVANLPEET
jgi:hypothetical protein